VCGVAVDASHIYWAASASIGRADLNGTGVPDPDFITGTTNACGVAVDGAHVYWANGNTIGRANLDGSSPNQNFITGTTGCSVAVDATHIYWGNGSLGNTGRIGRANLN